MKPPGTFLTNHTQNHLDEPCTFTIAARYSDVRVGVSGQETTVVRTDTKDFRVPAKGQLWFQPFHVAETLEAADGEEGKVAVGCVVSLGSGAHTVEIFGGWFCYLGQALREAYGGARDMGHNSGFAPFQGNTPASLADGFSLRWEPNAPGILGLTDTKGL